MKELSDHEVLNVDIPNQRELLNNTVELDNIIDTGIAKYAKSNGAVATFLVKDTAINELIKVCTPEEAEDFWKK